MDATFNRKASDYTIIEKTGFFPGESSKWFISGPNGSISSDFDTPEAAQLHIDSFDYAAENERLNREQEDWIKGK